nr:cytochrome P450 6J1 [Arma chinensis]
MLLYILVFVISILYLLFIYLSWNEDYWLKQRIPFIEPEKIFGNIKDVIFMKKTIGETYQEIYCKLHGKPVGGFFKMRQPILMVRNPDLIAEVLDKKFEYFHDNDIHVRRDADPILKLNPVLATGPIWKATRSVLTPLQSHETLEGLLHIVKISCKNMMGYINQQKIPIEVTDLSSKFTSDVIASCSLGTEPNSFKKCDTQFRKMSDKLLKKDLKSNVALLFALYAPMFGNLFSFRIISKDIYKYFVSLISDNCKHRVQQGIKRKDFLQRLIDINKESEASGEGTVYNYQSIMGHCMSVFINGYNMTSHPLGFVLYNLAMNPDVQDKLRKEIRTFSFSSVDALSYYLIESMEYLDMVVCETLRLHPPMPTLTRICTCTTELSLGEHTYKIEKGIPVTIPIYAIHTDPEYFPDPMKFDPERFDKKNRSLRHQYVYLPFGAGPRYCPGSKLALLILKSAIISIIMNFEVRPRGAIKEIEHDPMSSLVSMAKGEIWLRFKEHVIFY